LSSAVGSDPYDIVDDCDPIEPYSVNKRARMSEVPPNTPLEYAQPCCNDECILQEVVQERREETDENFIGELLMFKDHKKT